MIGMVITIDNRLQPIRFITKTITIVFYFFIAGVVFRRSRLTRMSQRRDDSSLRETGLSPPFDRPYGTGDRAFGERESPAGVCGPSQT